MSKFYKKSDSTRLNGAVGVSISEKGRTAFRKDYARLIHAPSFRRLQGKTQLFPGSESDFFRNRLTHSLEVAQIASGIAERINATVKEFKAENIDLDLVQFAALAHDLGHPPFGHNGEKALDQLMKEYGGFEGNAQTLRILTTTEKKLVEYENSRVSDFGLNLTYRTLASVLKYDHLIRKSRLKTGELEKGYYFTERDFVKKIKHNVAPGFNGSKFKTIECSIMDLADDIAYSTYDLEDSLHAGFVTPSSLLSVLIHDNEVRGEVFRKTNKALNESAHPQLNSEEELLESAAIIFDGTHTQNSDVLRAGVSEAFVRASTSVSYYNIDQKLTKNSLLRTQFTAERVGRLISAVEVAYNEKFPCLSSVRLGRDALISVEILKHLNFQLVIRSSRLAVVEYRGNDIVTHIFQAIIKSDGDLLPDDWKILYKQNETNTASKYRMVCDFVSGMTDSYAVEFHDALFGNGKSLYKPV